MDSTSIIEELRTQEKRLEERIAEVSKRLEALTAARDITARLLDRYRDGAASTYFDSGAP